MLVKYLYRLPFSTEQMTDSTELMDQAVLSNWQSDLTQSNQMFWEEYQTPFARGLACGHAFGKVVLSSCFD